MEAKRYNILQHGLVIVMRVCVLHDKVFKGLDWAVVVLLNSYFSYSVLNLKRH